jgi:hypothetical protein
MTDLTDISNISQYGENDTPTRHRDNVKTISIRKETWTNLRKLTRYGSTLSNRPKVN